MQDEQNGRSPALTKLRRQLADGLARTGLNKTQLANRAGLGRTTVSEAFPPKDAVPSTQTVAALARALKLPAEELLELQRTAAENPGTVKADGTGPGRPMGEWDPHALEVHPAGPASEGTGSSTSAQRALPGYVLRGHDRGLAEAVRAAGQGRSRIVVLVGTSSTGKTRACWEAIQQLAEKGWRLWHPFDPTRAEAAPITSRRSYSTRRPDSWTCAPTRPPTPLRLRHPAAADRRTDRRHGEQHGRHRRRAQHPGPGRRWLARAPYDRASRWPRWGPKRR